MSEPNSNRESTDPEALPPADHSGHDAEQSEGNTPERISGFFPASAERSARVEHVSDTSDLLNEPAGDFLASFSAQETQPESESSVPSLGKSLRPSLLGLLALVGLVTGVGYYNSRKPALVPEASATAAPEATTDIYESDIFPELKQGTLLAQTQPDSAVEPVTPAEPVQAEIVGKEVNLRARPSLQATIVQAVKQGESYLLTGRTQQAEDLNWVELKVKEDLNGWVSERFIKTSQPLPSPTPPPRGDSAADKLLLEDGQGWLNSAEEVQLVTGKALLSEIFKDTPENINLEHLVKLNACLTASAEQDDLTELKVYQLASACALATEWR